MICVYTLVSINSIKIGTEWKETKGEKKITVRDEVWDIMFLPTQQNFHAPLFSAFCLCLCGHVCVYLYFVCAREGVKTVSYYESRYCVFFVGTIAYSGILLPLFLAQWYYVHIFAPNTFRPFTPNKKDGVHAYEIEGFTDSRNNARQLITLPKYVCIYDEGSFSGDNDDWLLLLWSSQVTVVFLFEPHTNQVKSCVYE